MVGELIVESLYKSVRWIFLLACLLVLLFLVGLIARTLLYGSYPPGPIAKRESRPMHETPLMVEEALIIVKAQVIEVR